MILFADMDFEDDVFEGEEAWQDDGHDSSEQHELLMIVPDRSTLEGERAA